MGDKIIITKSEYSKVADIYVGCRKMVCLLNSTFLPSFHWFLLPVSTLD